MKFKDFLKSELKKESYTKSDLLNDKYSLASENNIDIYYAPFDYINKEASIIIIGITPGWQQMEKAFRTVIKLLCEGNEWSTSMLAVKKEASFAGPMRNNLVSMLDELGLPEKIEIETTMRLFDTKNNLVHTTSFLKNPVFYKGRNYNGKTPDPFSIPILAETINSDFIKEINQFENRLIIPLGRSVSKVIKKLNEENLLNENVFLEHFPHPSGANGHRKKQFEVYKYTMQSQIANWKHNLKKNEQRKSF